MISYKMSRCPGLLLKSRYFILSSFTALKLKMIGGLDFVTHMWSMTFDLNLDQGQVGVKAVWHFPASPDHDAHFFHVKNSIFLKISRHEWVKVCDWNLLNVIFFTILLISNDFKAILVAKSQKMTNFSFFA